MPDGVSSIKFVPGNDFADSMEISWQIGSYKIVKRQGIKYFDASNELLSNQWNSFRDVNITSSAGSVFRVGEFLYILKKQNLIQVQQKKILAKCR